MMADLGAAYLYFAIQVLHNACPAKGYTAHVLGYTLHAILETISKVRLPKACLTHQTCRTHGYCSHLIYDATSLLT